VELTGINRRITYWRERRGLTQSDFGALMGRSRSWVQKLESGDRQLDPRISVLEKVSEVLSVRLDVLLSDEASAQAAECVDAAEVAAIRAALHRYDVVTGVFDTAGSAVPSLEAVSRQASYGWEAFQAAHYSALGRLLPDLIVAAQLAAAAADPGQRRDAVRQLSLVYQLVTVVLLKFSDAALGWHAADRAILVAEQSADPVVMASATRFIADALLHIGQQGAAVQMCTAAAARLHDDLMVGSPAGISVFGMLFLKGAVAAAAVGDTSGCADLLAAAESAAGRLGRDGNAMWTGFGPTNCQVHRVATHVLLGDGSAACAAAEKIEPAALASLPRERRAAHLVDVAHGLAMSGQRDKALSTLLAAERLAAQEVHCRPYAREVITGLACTSVPVPSRELRGLAERAGAEL
jgi:transcriptional regulator with XRE-family HTH domain